MDFFQLFLPFYGTPRFRFSIYAQNLFLLLALAFAVINFICSGWPLVFFEGMAYTTPAWITCMIICQYVLFCDGGLDNSPDEESEYTLQIKT